MEVTRDRVGPHLQASDGIVRVGLRVDQFRSSLIALVVGTALKIFL